MKLIKTALLAMLLVGPMTVAVAGVPHAHAFVHGGFRGPGHWLGVGVGVGLATWPLWSGYYPYGYYPYGYYPYTAYPPVVVTQEATPTAYVEQQAVPPQGVAPQVGQQTSLPSNDWFYCHKPEGYYPYVRNCQEEWQRVPAQPPAQH